MRRSSKGQLGALLGQASGSDPHRSTDSRPRRSSVAAKGRGRSSSSDSESDGDEPDANPDSEQASGHFYVFDEWLASNSDDKAVDIFGEEARLPILFFMLIKILTQGIRIDLSRLLQQFALKLLCRAQLTGVNAIDASLGFCSHPAPTPHIWPTRPPGQNTSLFKSVRTQSLGAPRRIKGLPQARKWAT